MAVEHLIERRARLLADSIGRQKNLLRNAIAPPGTRPPFSTQLSEVDALAFWQRNRHSALGKKALERMQPADIMELDLALAKIEGGQNGLQG